MKAKETKMQTAVIRKLLTVAMLTCLLPPAFSQNWLKVNEQNGSTTYIDSFTIREDKNLPMVWMLSNYSSRSPFGAMSSIAHTEFDCMKNRYRHIQSIGYSEPMGEGKVTTIETPSKQFGFGFVSDWYPIKPGSGLEPVLKTVCR